MATKNPAAMGKVIELKRGKEKARTIKKNVKALEAFEEIERLSKGKDSEVEEKLTKFNSDLKATVNKLIRKSTVSFEKASSNKDRIELMLKVVINAIPVAEGLYRYKPGQSTGYLLTNLINQCQGLMEQLENYVDYDKLARNCMREVLEPKMEGIILELGKIIRDTLVGLQDSVSVKEKKKVKIALDNIFMKFGKSTKEKLSEIETELSEFMKEG